MAATSFTPLTERKRRYLKGLADGLTKTQAARFAGYAASVRTSQIENASVKAHFARLIRVKIPPQKLADVVTKGLEATRAIPGEGGITEVPDFKERREYTKMAADWAGYVDKDGPQTTVQVGVKLVNRITTKKGGGE